MPQLSSDDPKQIILKMAWFLMLGTKPIFIRICMGSSEHNRGNMSLITDWWQNTKIPHGGIFHLNLSEYYNQITLVIPQIKFL